MSKFTDQDYLTTQQYQDDKNLNARIALHERFSINPYDWFRWVFDQFQLPLQARILELGSGPGTLWIHNLDRIPSGWQVTLSDLSTGMLAKTEAGLSAADIDFTFRHIDAQSIPLQDGSCDGVIANHMLYHVPDRHQAFAEIQRVLKPDGTLYAALNGDTHMEELATIIRQYAPAIPHPRNERDAVGLTLESAWDEFIPYFPRVEVRIYEPNGLHITEVEPLIAYIRSMLIAGDVSEDSFQDLRAYLLAEIAEKGAIDITKSTGMVIARL